VLHVKEHLGYRARHVAYLCVLRGGNSIDSDLRCQVSDSNGRSLALWRNADIAFGSVEHNNSICLRDYGPGEESLWRNVALVHLQVRISVPVVSITQAAQSSHSVKGRLTSRMYGGFF
jgi:hypothetical protein